MRINQIPTCYFPSTVLFVDDSRDFLLNFTLQLDDDIAFKIHNSPYDGLKAIQDSQQHKHVNQRVLSEYVDTNVYPMTNSTINLDLSSIHLEVYNQHRFNEISVVVVDYAMPGMSGLDFCRKMENSDIKRILLTGKADERTAIQAFNDGLIDMYIQKQNPNITDLINESIKNMQLRYFQAMSDIVVKMLSVKSPNCLQDPIFIEFFFNLVKENKIVEYYLIENSGTYLMLNTDAELSYLIVKNDHDMKMYYELALDNGASQNVLEALQKKEKVPFFWRSEGSTEIERNNWNAHLYPAKKIEGSEMYYYAYAKNIFSTEINTSNILPYNKFLDTLEIQ